MDYTVRGRSTGRGAFTDATVLRPGNGEVSPADHEESSRRGNHWERTWNDLSEGSHVFFIDVTNSGKECRSIESVHSGELKMRAQWEKGHWQQDDSLDAERLWHLFGPK